MCLFTNNKEPKIAEEDIVCYKILILEEFLGESRLLTPFRSEAVLKIIHPTERSLEEIIKEIHQKASEKVLMAKENHSAWYSFKVDSGAIHTYQTEIVAFTVAECEFVRNRNVKVAPIILKCVIPKGTPYWEGVDGRLRKSYASHKIIYKEML